MLDLGLAPATTLPEPGGLSYRELRTVVSVARRGPIVPFDVVELNPPADAPGAIAIGNLAGDAHPQRAVRLTINPVRTPATIVQQFYDRFGEGDLDAAVAMFAVGVRIVDPGLGSVEGLDAMRGYLVGLKEAVPDAHAVVERIFEVENTVIVEGRFMGTSVRSDGQPGSSGAKIDLSFADFARVSDERIAEYRTYYDQVSLSSQLAQMG